MPKSLSCQQRDDDCNHATLEHEDSPPSPTSSDSSIDEEEINSRITPFWPKYRSIFKSRGIRLDTVRDVKLFYKHRSEQPMSSICRPSSYLDDLNGLQDDDALCPDAGLPDNLFRGSRVFDSKRVVVKAVHAGSREYNVVCMLSRPAMRSDRMNHTIPVVDLFELSDGDVAFIVMEEWSSNLIASLVPCCLFRLLSALRQCIEHAAFIHKHNIAHLDISLMNLLTDYDGHYAYIDYEISRQFDGSSVPLVYNYRGTEIPPECERSVGADPFKIDVWALAVLILRACKLTGYWVPELMHVIKPMLDDEPNRRPSAMEALQAFDKMTTSLGYHIESKCSEQHNRR
ncbi:kinase-like domain-containing protein [Gymnopilus junonius]|uniref:Kinase-like domain-containing protein n=1 Tax=Gymnopilus junonius TaxID=109634 RepID=A0A9P5NWE6_GYMJU|nr:kinase-like domain-containing protein [Gymnopilus junonius]